MLPGTDHCLKTEDHRVIGTFLPDINSPPDALAMQKQAQKPDYKVQIYLNVLKLKYYEDKRNIWMQLLLNISNKVCVDKRH